MLQRAHHNGATGGTPVSSGLMRFARRRPVVAAAAALLGALAVWGITGQLYSLAQYGVFSARLAGMERVRSQPEAHSWVFQFRGKVYRVIAHTDPAKVAAARRIDTAWVFGSSGRIREMFVKRLIASQASDPMIDDLAEQLSALRTALRLDDSGYVDLMTRAVQDIAYNTIDSRLTLPAETLAEGRAVCSGKTVLLGALMMHEGYDTVVWVFDAQHHAALGVAANGSGFGGGRYAFVETTRRAYVGQVDSALAIPLLGTAAPQAIALGGTKRYDAGRETATVLAQLDTARSRTVALSAYEGYAQLSATWKSALTDELGQYRHWRRVADLIDSHSDDPAGAYATLQDAAYLGDAHPAPSGIQN